ncbi:serine/threonine-protein kinase [Microbulbifer sp. ZKSA006]|uniref:serine/threonine-protein kinase n=1 Tax=Microbulbifer sp. ZKSA006 TaxID=3243390 RepID=UPI004039D4E2
MNIKQLPLDHTRYDLIEFLGKGGEGSVFKAYDKHLRRNVAIKIIQFDTSATLLEAQAIAKCDSPHVIKIFDVLHNDRYVVIIMELIDTSQPVTTQSISMMTRTEFLHFILQVLEALQAIHKQGLLHLDLKPSNLLITPENQVKVVDFGVSEKLCTEHIKYKRAQTTKGSWECLTPEQILGQPVEESTDIFAVGLLIYVYLFKCHPFLVHDSLEETRKNILYATPPMLHSVSKLTTCDLTCLARYMLSKKSKSRPSLQSARNTIKTLLNIQLRREALIATQQIATYKPKCKRPSLKIMGGLLVSIMTIGFCMLIPEKQPPIYSTLIIPPVQINSTDNLLQGPKLSTYLLISDIILDEITKVVLLDPKRKLAAKKEWREVSTLNTKPTKLDIDEIIISELNCDGRLCNISLSIYLQEEQGITKTSTKTISTDDIYSIGRTVEYMLTHDLKLNTENIKEYMPQKDITI